MHSPDGAVVANWEFSVLAPAGALRSTVDNLLTFIQANLDSTGGELSETIALSQTTHFEADESAMRLAWLIQKIPQDSPQDSNQDSPQDRVIYWHNGDIRGYTSFIGFDKTRHTGVVILSNSGDVFADDDAVDEMGFTILPDAAKVSIVSTAWDRPHSWHDIE